MFSFAWYLSLAVGFLSLSQEILWVRLVSFALRGSTYSFAIVLLPFLLGVAAGAAVGKRWCEQRADLLNRSARLLAVAASIDILTLLLLPSLHGGPLLVGACVALIFVSAAMKSVMFPIAHHLGSQQSGPQLGRSVSKVYFGNIVGSTLGPIVTGYVLLDLAGLQSAFLFVGLGTGLVALACALRGRGRWPWIAFAPCLLAISLLFVSDSGRLLKGLTGGAEIGFLVQNRHGIVHTVRRGDAPDMVFGGNMYDGMLSVDMASNLNDLDRALVLLAVHPRPKRVLVVGMSAGAWTRILASSPEIEEVVVVEINPAYLELVRSSKVMAPVLQDKRVRVHVDDGRRWLRQNPMERFDLIVQNNTYHWRAYSTNLLSVEYLKLIRTHLQRGGIFAFNTTGSADVVRTAETVFSHTERRKSFIYASDQAFSVPRADATEVLSALSLEGSAVFPVAAFAAGGLARELATAPFWPASRRYSDLHFNPGVITDTNLLAEHAHGAWQAHQLLPGLFEFIDRARGLSVGKALP